MDLSPSSKHLVPGGFCEAGLKSCMIPRHYLKLFSTSILIKCHIVLQMVILRLTSPWRSLCSRSLLCLSAKATEGPTFCRVFSSCFLLETEPLFICLSFPGTPCSPSRLAKYFSPISTLVSPLILVSSCCLLSLQDPALLLHGG